jgi:hypothetical protein
MDDMTDTPAHARTAPQGWTLGQSLVAAVLVAAGLAITGIAFYVMWGTVTDVVRAYMHRQAWTVPVSGEIAFLFFYLAGVLLAWRKAPPVVARGLFMAGIVAGSVQLNVYAARGHLPDLTGHLLVTGAFFGVLVVGKMVITSLKGGKTRADRISAGEWMTHPVRSAALWWWMKAWNETSRDAALARYQKLLYARAVAQADERVGKGRGWRRRLPVTLRFQLSTGELPWHEFTGEDWQDKIRRHVRDLLSPPAPPRALPGAATEGTPAESPAQSPGPRQPRRQDDVASAAKKRAKVKRILAADLSLPNADVAARAGVSERTVSRIRSELQQPPGTQSGAL